MDTRKKFDLRRYAFVSLIVSGLAALVAIVSGLMIGLVNLQLFTVSDVEKWKTAAWVSLTFVVIGIAVFGIIDPDRVRRTFTGRRARYGSNSLVLTAAVLGILFMVNFLVFENPKSFDITEDKSHTLAAETLQALSVLPEKVHAVAFFSLRASTTTAEDLLQNFKVNSSGKFDYQFVDPDSDPITARQAGITGDGKIMLVMGDRKEIAAYADETELTRTLIRLISPEARVIYFLTGHGEADTAGSGNVSMSIAVSTLEGKNYTVKKLNLLAGNKIPEDAQAIVIAGPVKQLSSQEVNLLKEYLMDGGGLVVMENPPALTDFGDAPDPLADYLRSAWGIQLQNDIVIDLTNAGNELYATSASLSSHPITNSMTLAAILPQARSVAVNEAPEGVETEILAQTTEQSWGETDYASLSGEVKFDEGTDIAGPIGLAAAGENTTTGGRIAVFGNSIFASDQFFDSYGNGDIFINAVDWTAEQDNLIQITPRTPIQRTFKVPSQLQWLMILLGSVVIIPGMVIMSGISTWLARRKRG